MNDLDHSPRYIETTKNQATQVCAHDYERVAPYQWRAVWNGGSCNYYVEGRVNKQIVSLHRLIANTPSGLAADHINHNTLDNRCTNLRNVTVSENSKNRRSRDKPTQMQLTNDTREWTFVRVKLEVRDKMRQLAEAERRSMANYLESLIEREHQQLKAPK